MRLSYETRTTLSSGTGPAWGARMGSGWGLGSIIELSAGVRLDSPDHIPPTRRLSELFLLGRRDFLGFQRPGLAGLPAVAA